uniref:Putative Phospholipase D3-like n=1 Tax=Megacormus gertschi TaxID=1843536 RepID=A0A224X3P6_9SCOR
MWIVDNVHFYIGSSALDWLMVNQMKDIGVAVYNCSCVAEDLQKIFQLYWMLTETDSSIPTNWPTALQTSISKEVPLSVDVNETYTQLYISNSPQLLCPEGRSSDIDSILDIISKAKRYIYISVMDYMPIMCHNHNLRYWSILDAALRQAAIDRRVSIKILVSDWNKTHPSMFYFLKSLLALNSTLIHIDVRLFIMPIVSKRPYPPSPRVNRNSFMITERTLYISTFGWSGDNFLNMAGVGLVIDQSQNGTMNHQPIKQQFQSVFERDWTSSYAHTLSEIG